MTAQKIADILFNCGYELEKNHNGYETSHYTTRNKKTREIVYSCKGAKDLKEWFKIMDERYNYKANYNPLNVPEFSLDGRAR